MKLKLTLLALLFLCACSRDHDPARRCNTPTQKRKLQCENKAFLEYDPRCDLPDCPRKCD